MSYNEELYKQSIEAIFGAFRITQLNGAQHRDVNAFKDVFILISNKIVFKRAC
jgi:hypothetical protein